MQPKDIKDIIECPVCLEVPRGPELYICKNSHNICKNCYDQLESEHKKCPTCRVNIEAPIRNLSVEKLIETWKYECVNKKDGCSIEANLSQIVEHENDCKFGIVNCKHLGCITSLNKQDMIDHEDNCVYRLIPCVRIGQLDVPFLWSL